MPTRASNCSIKYSTLHMLSSEKRPIDTLLRRSNSSSSVVDRMKDAHHTDDRDREVGEQEAVERIRMTAELVVSARNEKPH